MHRRTALVLALLVIGLGTLVWFRQQAEQGGRAQVEGPLLPDLTRDGLGAMRVDHLERDVHLRLERGEDGAWMITDPLRYPADGAVVTHVLEALFLNRAQGFEGDSAALGLSPPRIVVELEPRDPGAGPPCRIEVGAIDLDRQHVFVRVDGRLVRTLRNVDSALDREVPDWRQHALLFVSPGAIAELQRRGRPPPGDPPADLALDAAADGGWRATSPWRAALAPEAIGALLTSLTSLRVAAFEDDAPGPLELYGLEPPDLRVEIAMPSGERHALRFAYLPGSDRVRCLVEGSPHIYRLEDRALVWLTAPSEALVDRELVRVVRERVSALRLVSEGRETRLERRGFAWWMTTQGGAGPAFDNEKADGERVADLLGRLDAARVIELLLGAEPPASPWPQAIYVEADGEEHGGAIGPRMTALSGAEGLGFLRSGDTLLGLVEASLSEIAATDPQSLRSRELHRVPELEVARLTLSAPEADLARAWRRANTGRWTPEGSEVEARDLAQLLDRLLNMRALSFPGPDDAPSGGREISAELFDRDGASILTFTLDPLSSQGPEEPTPRVMYVSGERRGVVDGQLYLDLRRMLGLD